MQKNRFNFAVVLLAALAIVSRPGAAAAREPDWPRVEELLRLALRDFAADRHEDARQRFAEAWDASASYSAEAALGLAQTNALLDQSWLAEEQARLASDLATEESTKRAADLLYGALLFRNLLAYEADRRTDGPIKSAADLDVRLAAAMAYLETGLKGAERDPTGARVILAEAYLHAGFSAKARRILDEYFTSGSAPHLRSEAENLRCLAGGPQADYRPPPPADEIVAPVKIFSPHPGYTEEARRMQWEGKAIVQAVVDERGRIACARMLKGAPHGLSETALSAVRQWRYEPARHRGEPTRALLVLAIDFRLGDGDGDG